MSAPTNMPFDGALYGLKRGARMTREAWGRPRPWVMLLDRPPRARYFIGERWRGITSSPGEARSIAAVDIEPAPFFLQYDARSGSYSTWLPTTTDILANDWEEYQP